MSLLTIDKIRPSHPSSACKGLILAIAGLVTAAVSATADVSFRFSATSNLIYVEGSGSAGIRDLYNASAAASTDWGFSLNTTDNAWESINPIIVTEGVSFNINPEVMVGSTVSTLRLKGDSNAYIGVIADHGRIVIDGMTITSWDFDSGSPDTDLNDGRPYLSAISSNAGESSLLITNSSINHLGWNNPDQCAANWVVKRSQSGGFSNSGALSNTFTDCFVNARDLTRSEAPLDGNTYNDCDMGDFDIANLGSNSANNVTTQELRARVDRVASSRRLYLIGPGPATLSYIRFFLERNFPENPDNLLANVSPSTWLLRAELRISQGARLNLHGSSIGGDCNELRLRSNGDNSIDDYTVIRADYGHVDMRNTLVTSWDEIEGQPDFTPNRDSFDPAIIETVSGRPEYRAHIWVVSRKPLNGQIRESRMDIINSTVEYLGYQAGKAYGLTWKVEDFEGDEPVVDSLENATGVPHAGCGDSPKIKQASVWGDIKNSTLQFMHFGVYTFGHGSNSVQTEWTNNEVANCNVYGFDPHDGSQNLLIANNVVRDNGKHGIIASKFCDNVIVRNNDVQDNGENGIMIHDGSNDAIVENNRCDGNGDSGVAIFDSCRMQVRNNTLTNNGNAGFRLSVGSSFGLFEDNEIDGSGQYGIFAFAGTDVAQYSDPDKINTGNVFRNNIVRNTVGEGIKIQNSLNTVFDSNTFSEIATNNPEAIFRFEVSMNTLLRNNTMPNSSVLKLRDENLSGDRPASIIVSEQDPVDIEFTSSSGFIWDPGTVDNTMTPRNLSVLIDSTDDGHLVVSPQVWNPQGKLSKRIITRSDRAGQVLRFQVGDLIPATDYEVFKDGNLLATSTSSNAGVLFFTDTAVNSATATFEIFTIDDVTPPSAGYLAFINNALPDGAPKGFEQDADSDGFGNGAEYALGTNPAVAERDSDRRPHLREVSGAIEVRFGPELSRTDFDWVVYRSTTELSADGNEWEEVFRRSASGSDSLSYRISASFDDDDPSIFVVKDSSPPSTHGLYLVEFVRPE